MSCSSAISRPERRHAIADEVVALGIGLLRTLGIPQALAQQRRRRQRDLGRDAGDLLHELRLGGDEARRLGRELFGHHRPGPAVGRVDLERETVRQLGDDADVGAPAPFAVVHDVEAGAFLQGDDEADRRIHRVGVGLVPFGPSRSARARPAGGESSRRSTRETAAISSCRAHGSHSVWARFMSSCVSISRYLPGVSAWPNEIPCSIMSWNMWIRYAFWKIAASR